MFTNIKESINERHEECEVKVRQFIVEKLAVAQDLVDSIQFERVHIIGVSGSTSGAGSTTLRPRNIVAKFSLYKDKEMVRRAKSKLRGTDHYIFEQFPKEIADKRRSLVPKMRKAIGDGKRAWISYDTHYINGRSFRDDDK